MSYNITALSNSGSFDSLASFALASVGLVFCIVALLKISSIAWHNMSQTLARHWHFGSHFTRQPSRGRS